VLQLLVTANFFPNALMVTSLMMEAIFSSETSVLTTATKPHIPEDGVLQSHHRKNLKSYKALTDWAL
jgi:hypothetical protein